MAETVQDLLRFRLPGVDGGEELAAIHGGIFRQSLAGAVPFQQGAGAALAGHVLALVRPGIRVGVHKAVLPGGEVGAPHQLSVGDDAAAHAGADEKHRRVAATLQDAALQLGHGSGFAVVFQQDAAAAFFGQALSHWGAGVVQQRAAVGNKAGLAVHKAGQGHGDAVHLVPVRGIQGVNGVEKVFLGVLRRGH